MDAKIFRSFLSETLTEDEVDLSSTVVPQTSGNVLTTASFNGGSGATYLIDTAYTISAGTTVEVPDGSTLYYRGAGKITSLGSGSGEGKIKFQDTLLKGSVQNNVGLADGATLANSSVRTSWFCPAETSGASNANRLDKLNALIAILDCQILDFDQNFTLETSTGYIPEPLQRLALDGVRLKSNIRYHGNNQTICLKTAHAAFNTFTHGDPGNFDVVKNIEIAGFNLTIDENGRSDLYARNYYSQLNLGCVRNAFVHDCNFNGWWGTAITINYVYNNDESYLTAKLVLSTADNIHIKNCKFDCWTDPDSLTRVGNGITVSNGQHIIIEDCTFNDVDAGWPGPIDFEAEVETGGVAYDDIKVRCNKFNNCGNRAAINLAGLVTSESPLEVVNTHVGHIQICNNEINGAKMGISVASLYPVTKSTSNIEIYDNSFNNISNKAVVITDYHEGSYYNHLCNIKLTNCSFTAASSSAKKGDYNALRSIIDPDSTCILSGFSS